MICLTFYTLSEDALSIVTEGETFAIAAQKLTEEILGIFGDVHPAVYQGLAALSAGCCNNFKHQDFSCPEDQFELDLEKLNPAQHAAR